MLRIAIQKSGRLNEESQRLLAECGIRVDNGADQLKAVARNFPLQVYYLRNSDIPQYLADGVCDAAIVGENTLKEKGLPFVKHLALGFGRCRLSLAIPKSERYTDISWFNGKRIATSYPNTLRKILQERAIDAEIHEISGSVEIAPNIGLADGICDLVSSGGTLERNGLKEVESLFSSEACLVSSSRISSDAQTLLDRLVFRLVSVLNAQNNKYVLLNAPNHKIQAISQILPGIKSPTVMPLAEPGWSSLHSVIGEDRFWEILDQLKAAGAEGILIIPIEKMVS